MRTRLQNLVKSSACLLVSCLFFGELQAQTQDFKWAQALGSVGNETATGITHDASGNVYVTGSLAGTASVVLEDATTVNLPNAGSTDVFIAKINSSGKYVWVKTIGSAGADLGYKIEVDFEGNILVAGQAVGTVDFNPGGAPQQMTLTGAAAFVLKLTPNGEFVWVKSYGSNGGTYAYALDVDNLGNVYTGGRFAATVDFDPGADEYKLSANAEVPSTLHDAYVLKLDKDGSFVWAKSFGGKGWDVVNGIAVDNLQNVHLTGRFSETANFNPDPLGTAQTVTANFQDAFIVKLNSEGVFVWNRAISGNAAANDAWGQGIAVDKIGNVFGTGFFSGTASFKPVGTNMHTSGGSRDIYVVKINPVGDLLWSKGIGLASDDRGEGIAVDGNGDAYITGKFAQNAVDFGNGVSLTAGGQFDVFVVKIKGDGTTKWADRFGGTTAEIGVTGVSAGADSGQSISVDLAGNVYTAGIFVNTAIFDFPDKTVKIASVGVNDAFVHKFAQINFVLPVELSKFYIQKQSDGNKLVWETASETNNSHFELQKSVNGVTFELIKTVIGNGTSAKTNSYSYLDADVNNYTIYYRLKQVDKNGEAKYSNIIVSKNNELIRTAVTIYPNPIVDKLTIKSPQPFKNASLRILNSTGGVELVKNSLQGNEITLDMSTKPKGLYLLELNNEGDITTHKLIK